MAIKIRAVSLLSLSMFVFLLQASVAQVDLSGIIGALEHAHTLPVRFGFINLDTGNLHLEIPLYSVPERGHPAVTNTLVYDSTFWNYWPLTGGQEMLYPTTAGWGGGGQFYPDDMGGAVTGTLYETLSCSQRAVRDSERLMEMFQSGRSTNRGFEPAALPQY